MIRVFGITGTNGKTTASWMLRNILEQISPCGLIGTIEHIAGNIRHTPQNTTPGRHQIAQLFSEMSEQGIGQCVMEVSSQAYMMDRVAGITFDYGVFTNIEPDHIGTNEHADFEDYMNCKKQLLQNCRTAM